MRSPPGSSSTTGPRHIIFSRWLVPDSHLPGWRDTFRCHLAGLTLLCEASRSNQDQGQGRPLWAVLVTVAV